LLFVSGVVQKMMNGMEPLEFKKFANVLGRTAISDPLAVTIATNSHLCSDLLLRGVRFQSLVVHRRHRRLDNRLRHYEGHPPAHLSVGRAAGECRPRSATEEASHARAGERVARLAHASFCRHDGMPVQHRRNRDCHRRVRHHRLPVALVGTQIHTEWLASLENKRVIQSGTTFFCHDLTSASAAKARS
jgi:hypothetical protein